MARMSPARTTRTRIAVGTRIQMIRGQRVLLDTDLAALYNVSTSHLNQTLKRHRRRFPSDFAFRLSAREAHNLKSQFVISSSHGGRRTRPWAYTEHGAIMAASLLNTQRAIQMSVYVVRAFVRLRELAAAHATLSAQLDALERRVTGHDDELERVVATLRMLLAKPVKTRRSIGFTTAPASVPQTRLEGSRATPRRLPAHRPVA
jgi:hypothetical protein